MVSPGLPGIKHDIHVHDLVRNQDSGLTMYLQVCTILILTLDTKQNMLRRQQRDEKVYVLEMEGSKGFFFQPKKRAVYSASLTLANFLANLSSTSHKTFFSQFHRKYGMLDRINRDKERVKYLKSSKE